MTKEDLLNSYKHVTNNSYLRRLAESLATEISEYAEKNKLDGDLINTESFNSS
jgi:hypothetical protein